MEKQEFITHFEKLSSKISLHEDAASVVYSAAEKVFASSDAVALCDTLDDAMFKREDNMFARVQTAGGELGIEPNEFTLFMCVYHSVRTKELYIKMEYDIDVYYATMSEITIWSTSCFKRTAAWGIDDHYGSVCNVLRPYRFRLGRFLFELNEAAVDEPFDLKGLIVKPGAKVIQIHIPEGDSITYEKRIDAYQQAYAFFKQTGCAVFQCESWLFYDKHREFLPKTSNILDFMNDFEYYCYEDFDEPRNFWRIFGWFDSYDDVDKLPQNTGLQKAYAKWWAENHKTGRAWGLMMFDGKEIVR